LKRPFTTDQILQVRRLGAANKSTHLTDDDVREMRRLRLAGATLKQLSVKYRMAEGSISRVCNRGTWSHLP
jgi:hypothetical protein